MQSYDINVMIAKQKNGYHTYAEEYDVVMEFEEDVDIVKVQEKVSNMIDVEIATSKDIVVFGSVTITMSETHQLIMNFKNTNLDEDEVDEIMDLILIPEEIMH